MLTVQSPFTLDSNSTSYGVGDRITDPDAIAAALAQARMCVVQTATVKKPDAVAAKQEPSPDASKEPPKTPK